MVILRLSLLMSLILAMGVPVAQAQSSDIVEPKIKRAAPPKMPGKMKRSGYCCVAYDVSTNGRAMNITAPYCTEVGFEAAAIKAVSKYRYEPATQNGEPIQYSGPIQTVTFMKSTAKRYPVAGADGYLEPRVGKDKIPKPPRDFMGLMKWQRKYFNDDKVCQTLPDSLS